MQSEHVQRAHKFPVTALTTGVGGFAPMIAVGLEQPLRPVPLSLEAAEVLPNTPLSGDGYSIKDIVSNDGFQNTYTIESQVDPEARTALEARGWKVGENAQLAFKAAVDSAGKPVVSPAGVGKGVVR